jgi:hypothetical protein
MMNPIRTGTIPLRTAIPCTEIRTAIRTAGFVGVLTARLG